MSTVIKDKKHARHQKKLNNFILWATKKMYLNIQKWNHNVIKCDKRKFKMLRDTSRHERIVRKL